MERKDLLLANAQIFSAQGKALDDVATNVRVLVVGNPANTNSLIAMKNAPSLDPKRFTAMMRLDHNRAMSQLAGKTGTHVTDLKKMMIWGNHSPPSIPTSPARSRASRRVAGRPGLVQGHVHPDRAAARRRDHQGARRSSAASAASAAIDHIRDWALGTPAGDWVRMAVPSDGSYGIPEASSTPTR